MRPALAALAAAGGFSGISAGAVVLGLAVAAALAGLLVAADRAVERLADSDPCIGENPDLD